jgi:hypothetical protein
MIQSITIPRRFCGPPDSGNGGYVCGRLASFIDGPALVRLQVPPPLDEQMEVRPVNGGVEMVRGGTIVATALPAQVVLDVPPPPGFAESEFAARSYVGFRSHPYPTCFVCGPRRTEGDGLRIFPGRHAGTKLVASPWIPDATLGDATGTVRPEFMWAALDCPGAFSFALPVGSAVLLGELAADLKKPLAAGERCVVIGWEFARDGRRHYTGTALFSESGECRGMAKATWFEVPANR